MDVHVDYEGIISSAVVRLRTLLPDHTVQQCREIVEEELAQLLAERIDEQVQRWGGVPPGGH